MQIKDKELLRDDIFRLHIHLLNIIAEAKEKIDDRRVLHDLFHATMNYNCIAENLGLEEFVIDYDEYYN
jgi:hypothetical protein